MTQNALRPSGSVQQQHGSFGHGPLDDIGRSDVKVDLSPVSTGDLQTYIFTVESKLRELRLASRRIRRELRRRSMATVIMPKKQTPSEDFEKAIESLGISMAASPTAVAAAKKMVGIR